MFIRPGESQTDFVRRTLLANGSIATADAIFDLRELGTGKARSITRLGARIHELRRQGLRIRTEAAPGRTATYHLR